MDRPPPPPALPGASWRPAVRDDAARLAALAAAVDAVDRLPDPGGPETYRYWLSYPGLDVEHDTLLAVTPVGDVLAMVFVIHQHTPARSRVVFWFEAHPDHVDLEPFLLAWAEHRGRDILARAEPGVPRRLRIHVDGHRQRLRDLVEAAGYRHARTFVEMRRDLARPLPDPGPAPPGITIVPWAPDLDDGARLASNAAFDLHWDSLPLSMDEWRQRHTGDDIFRPDLSVLALHDGRVVSLSLATVDPEFEAHTGVCEVWIDRLGTAPGWQRRGLATALLVETLRRSVAAGAARAGLSVDEDSTTRATALYERLGFSVDERSLTYVKDLEPR
jgi:mycothiol synthase